MANISEHQAELEWESHTRKYSRVNFFVRRHTISVNNFLKGPSKCVIPEVGRGFSIMVFHFFKFRGTEIRVFVLYLREEVVYILLL